MVIQSRCLSWCLSQPGTDRSPGKTETSGFHHSLECLVFRYKISCHWIKGVSTNEGEAGGTPPLKRRYSTVIAIDIGSYNAKMVADRHRHALIITSTGDDLFRNVNIDDLE